MSTRIDALGERFDGAMTRVSRELAGAIELFGPMASPHEAIAVIREEYLELERHVFSDTGRTAAAAEEAIQLAAMAVRYVVDLWEPIP